MKYEYQVVYTDGCYDGGKCSKYENVPCNNEEWFHTSSDNGEAWIRLSQVRNLNVWKVADETE